MAENTVDPLVPQSPDAPAGTPNDRSEYLDAIGSLLVLHRYLRKSSKARSEAGISGRQLAMLRFLMDGGPATVGTLAKYLFISESATSEFVGKLQRQGLVERVRAATDNRVVQVSVTPAGVEVVERTPVAGIPLLRERMKSLSDAELRSITKSIRTLIDILEIPNA